MRRLIVQEFVTVDGLAAGPKGEVDFIPAATEGDSVLAEQVGKDLVVWGA